MNFTNEQVLKAAMHCNASDTCTACPFDETSAACVENFAKYICEKENEPASAPTETSSVKKEKILHSNCTAKSEICQAPDLVEIPIMLKGFIMGLFNNSPVKWTELYGSSDCASAEFVVNGRKYAICIVCEEDS